MPALALGLSSLLLAPPSERAPSYDSIVEIVPPEPPITEPVRDDQPPTASTEAPREAPEITSDPPATEVADSHADPASTLPDLRFRVAIDVPLTLGFAGVWAVTEGFRGQIAPRECGWCRPRAFDAYPRERLRWAEPEAAALTSDVLAYGVIPALTLTLTLVAVGREGEWRKLHEDLVVALEAVAVTAALTNAIKLMSARQRPYAHYASEAIDFADDSDQNLGFPSGHTSFAFALATGVASVATLRGRKLAPVFWGLGVPLAGFVGYLRIAGDRHWLSDVLMGASLGTLVGVGLPFLLHHPRTGLLPRAPEHHQRRRHSLWLAPAPNGLLIGGQI